MSPHVVAASRFANTHSAAYVGRTWLMTRCNVRLSLVASCLFVASCGSASSSEPKRWVEETSAPLPARLSEVGIYEDVTSRRPYDDVVPYEPKHALYSNGLEKERHLYLPEGAAIDASREPWVFPVGTVLTKTFLDGDDPLETRLIFLTDEGWDYAIYQWMSRLGDAERLEGNWAEVPVTGAAGERIHTLPSRLDCRTCHETHEAVAKVPVLGIGSLQTAPDLVEADVFSRGPVLATVQGRTPEETAALSYFVGNCISCHNGGDSINSSFSLYPEDAVDNTVDQAVVSETGEGLRVVAGDETQSVLYITVVEADQPEYRGPFKAMPPLGIDVTDSRAEEILGDWIRAL